MISVNRFLLWWLSVSNRVQELFLKQIRLVVHQTLQLGSHLLKKHCFICFKKPFKNDEKCFLFYLKSSFLSQEFKFLPLFFGYVEKTISLKYGLLVFFRVKDIFQIIPCFCHVKKDFLGSFNIGSPHSWTIKLYVATDTCQTISLM